PPAITRAKPPSLRPRYKHRRTAEFASHVGRTARRSPIGRYTLVTDHGPTAMSIPTTEARVLLTMQTEADRFLPEGPQMVTVAGRPGLAWVNIQTAGDATRGTVHLWFWHTAERRRYDLPARPGFFRPTDRPGVV